MTTVNRPNKKAMTDVIDIYRDVMRPFLVHHLRRVPGKRLEEAIGQALRDSQRIQFEDNLRKGNSIEDSIDVGDFPELVASFWRSVFSDIFLRDRSALNYLYEIRNIRDEAAHPNSADLDAEKTRTHIYMVTKVLERINSPEEKKAVEAIRDKHFTTLSGEMQPQSSTQPNDDVPLADHSDLHESDNKYHEEPGCKLSLKIHNPCLAGRECPRRPRVMCGQCQRIRLSNSGIV